MWGLRVCGFSIGAALVVSLFFYSFCGYSCLLNILEMILSRCSLLSVLSSYSLGRGMTIFIASMNSLARRAGSDFNAL